MPDESWVIIELSSDLQILFQRQGVDLYQELQRSLPSIRLSRQTDPETPRGSRDIVTVISVTTSLVVALTPIIRQILNMITPPNRSESWIIDESETVYPDGSRTIYRKRVRSNNEQRISELQLPNEQMKAQKPSSPPETTVSGE